jgi:protocatechuate 3,4-dioxygenase beta subunit
MTHSNPNRRGILGWALSALGLSLAGRPAVAADLTPSAAEGPFYPTPSMRRADVDNDLVKIMGKVKEAGGEVFLLKGRVLDASGAPLAGKRIEIWQCDVNGKYMHPGDRQDTPFDAAFQGFGHDITGPDGGYVFRTIKPVTYPGRTPHIHVKLFDGATELLTSQFYIDGHPANQRDGLFRRLSRDEAAAVSMVFVEADGQTEARVDVIVRNA